MIFLQKNWEISLKNVSHNNSRAFPTRWSWLNIVFCAKPILQRIHFIIEPFHPFHFEFFFIHILLFSNYWAILCLFTLSVFFSHVQTILYSILPSSQMLDTNKTLSCWGLSLLQEGVCGLFYSLQMKLFGWVCLFEFQISFFFF